MLMLIPGVLQGLSNPQTHHGKVSNSPATVHSLQKLPARGPENEKKHAAEKNNG